MVSKIAVVTGANRGIGFEVVRQLAKQGVIVILTSRDSQNGQAAVEQLAQEGLTVYFHAIDVTSDESVKTFANNCAQTVGKIDILINNAGIFPEQAAAGNLLNQNLSLFDIPLDMIRLAFETNTLGSLRMIRACVPIMNSDARIVNISSGLGQLSKMDSGYAAYRLSKTALNAVTKIAADELKENTDITVNSVCPGWVKTRMGGARAPKSVEQGADSIVWLALGADGINPNGKFFRDRQEIGW